MFSLVNRRDVHNQLIIGKKPQTSVYGDALFLTHHVIFFLCIFALSTKCTDTYQTTPPARGR